MTALNRSIGVASIVLQECPKVYLLETHRSKTPEATLRVIERTGNQLDLISPRDVTDLDRIGLPVFTCDRIRPDGSRTTHTGKGVSKTQAQVSLTMEAIERYCSEFRDEYRDRLVFGSYRELRQHLNLLDPEDLILPAFSNYRPDHARYWVWGFDLSVREEILIPAGAVYHPFALDEHPLIRTHTNGLATGNTIEEAIFHGMTEVIERDAWSIARFRQDMNAALSVEDRAEHRFLLEIIEKYERAGIEVTARDLTTDLGVPVIAAFAEDLHHPGLPPCDGFGAHLDPRVAMARALLELAATRAWFLQKHGRERLQRPSSPRHGEPDGEDPRFHASELKPLGEMPSRYSHDLREDIRTLLETLERCRIKHTLVVPLTRPELGIPTVRVIIPGLEVYCFDRERKGDRLYQP